MFRHFLFQREDHRCGGGRHDARGERGGGPWGHRGRWGGRGEGWGGHGPGFGGPFGRGGGRERMFDGGELQLVILNLLAEQPSYGYQIIKTLEERMAGGYVPSAGVIYPTLTLLEEEGFATVISAEGGRKTYAVTDAGKAHLEEQKQRLHEVSERLKQAGKGFARGRSPELMEAFVRLRNAVAAKVSREGLTAEQTKKIAEAINAAARTIDEL